jgi:hypothetical protein
MVCPVGNQTAIDISMPISKWTQASLHPAKGFSAIICGRNLNNGAQLLVMAVFGRVMLAGLFCMMGGVIEMAFRDMRVVASLLMITCVMVVSSHIIMFGSLLAVLRRFAMVLCCDGLI